jgi:serine/threonine-protein kinase
VSDALAAGEKLDRYTIVEAIGHGAFSDVYLATDADGARVVLKCPHEGIIGDVATFDRFRREMEIARRLDHPGIQHSLDPGGDRTRPYLVMQYVEGETLREYLGRRGRLPIAEAVALVDGLAAAMGYAHGKGVTHRDLKPENVLVTPDGRPVVTDFGIALIAGARRLTWRWLTSQIGTPDYMAPEQVVILFELLVGRVPWEGDNPLSVMNQAVTRPAPSLRELDPTIPPPLDAIVRKCLRKDPAERYPDAAALSADLESWKDLDLSRFVFAAEERPPSPAGRRGPILLVAGISLGFLGASALFVLLVALLQHH